MGNKLTDFALDDFTSNQESLARIITVAKVLRFLALAALIVSAIMACLPLFVKIPIMMPAEDGVILTDSGNIDLATKWKIWSLMLPAQLCWLFGLFSIVRLSDGIVKTGKVFGSHVFFNLRLFGFALIAGAFIQPISDGVMMNFISKDLDLPEPIAIWAFGEMLDLLAVGGLIVALAWMLDEAATMDQERDHIA